MARNELERVGEIDRSEQIDALYVQDGATLTTRPGDWSAPAWDPSGGGEHSVAAQRRELEALLDEEAVALGAFAGHALVGIGVVRDAVRPGTAQLAYLHVTRSHRASGIGGRLADLLEAHAREGGASAIVVSATPSVNTVDFYARRGYVPMAQPLPALLEREPEDVHMAKSLRPERPD